MRTHEEKMRPVKSKEGQVNLVLFWLLLDPASSLTSMNNFCIPFNSATFDFSRLHRWRRPSPRHSRRPWQHPWPRP